MYQVVLTGNEANQKIATQVYGEGYFPQKFTFTRDAKILVKRLQDLEVSAKIENEKQAKQSVKQAEQVARRAARKKRQ